MNDYWDDEYAIIATYTTGLESREHDVVRHYELLCTIVGVRLLGQEVLARKFDRIWRD